MEIHVASAFGSVIIGAAVLGPVGALLALPAAATMQAFISSYVHRHEVDETALARVTSKRRRGSRAPPALPP
jgi:predicted PurR-regulated permease PerM